MSQVQPQAPETNNRITCHILDTTAGQPAKGVQVRLVGPGASTAFPSDSSFATTYTFQGETDDDGRIKFWKPDQGSITSTPIGLNEVLDDIKDSSRWTLHFDTEGYFGKDKTFFPEAIVVIRVQQGQKYHVPLLLSPFTYTTYRGS